ncbi:MAG: AmmeMemoRadiSam system protein B [Proteobacteria bacterium]|nr:AmmeMemoRadiSam system protein B [Pseudomonadota bacterium]
MARPQQLRVAELAGSWYPATPAGCQASFGRFERGAVDSQRTQLVGGIVPHAGWAFSGAIAYNVVRELAAAASASETIVLFAGHLGPDAASTVMQHGQCWTPFGPLDTDEALVQQLATAAPLRAESPLNHTQDNSAEVVFPLIKHFFPAARLVILGAPPRAATLQLADAVVEAARRLGRPIAVIASTDLTHYGPNYGWTPQGSGAGAERWVRETNDPLFLAAACEGTPLEVLQTGRLHRNACCPGAVAAAWQCAQRLGASSGERLRYATSADVRPNASFVGYAGVVY